MANAEQKIQIVGIGDDGLDGVTAAARALIERAQVLIGSEETLARVAKNPAAKTAAGTPANQRAGNTANTPAGNPANTCERFAVGNNPEEAVKFIRERPGKAIVVLASGDPLFYGVARYLCDKLGKERFEVTPHVSTMQLAFARVKESWEEAFLTNLANHRLDSVAEKVRIADKVGLFTTEDCTPADVARGLLARGIDYFTAYVCENLGSPDERVTHGELSELVGEQFSPLNVMILVHKPEMPDRPADAVGRRLFGNPDEAFLQSRPKYGLLTPFEVRAMALAELDLGPSSTVWDIGAGSGSVSIEAAQIASDGKTYAIEMDPDDHLLIRSNAQRFGVKNLVPVLGRAPEAWADLPDPDAVFIGGSGREISHLLELAYDRLRPGGRLVANVGSIENLSAVHETLQRRTPAVKVWMINIARGTHQLERFRFAALNPTFLLAVVKPR